MAMSLACLSFFFILVLADINYVSAERIKDKMYMSLDGVYCFRRLNATKVFGCSSSPSGDYGVIHFIDSLVKDTKWLIESSNAGPYVPVVDLNNFKRKEMIDLRDSGKVSGMLLYKNSTPPGFSTEDSCPNRYTGLKSEECEVVDAWNPVGTSLFYEDWGFPIAYISNETIVSQLRECFSKYNADLESQNDRSLCAVQIQSHMLAAVDSRTCLRRTFMLNNLTPVKFCDALGDYNVYLTTQPALQNVDKSLIMLIARHDVATLFDALAPGALSPITNIVTMLTVASLLKDMGVYNQAADKNIMLVLLNGEAFDYIGSSRIVYDMQQGVFPSQENPLKFEQIGLIVELDQISGNHLFYHSQDSPTGLAADFVNKLTSELGSAKVNLTPSRGKLPPSSIQRFLMADPSLPSLVLSNYNSSYYNPYYHSILDDATALKYVYGNGTGQFGDIQNEINKIAEAIAKTLYYLLKGEDYKVSTSKLDLVDELLHCYLETQNCTLFNNASNGAGLLDTPAPVYVGVYGTNTTITQLTGLTMAALTGKVTVDNETVCNNRSSPNMQYIWMKDKCIESAVSYSLAYSPAFEIKDYDWLSNNYSTWTESTWRELNMRMFLKPSIKQQVFTLSSGLFVLVISFMVVYHINAKADILFNKRVLSTAEGAW